MREIRVATEPEEGRDGTYMGNARLMRQMEPHTALAVAWLANEYRLLANPRHLSPSDGVNTERLAAECLDSLYDGTLAFWCDIAGVEHANVLPHMLKAAEKGGLL